MGEREGADPQENIGAGGDTDASTVDSARSSSTSASDSEPEDEAEGPPVHIAVSPPPVPEHDGRRGDEWRRSGEDGQCSTSVDEGIGQSLAARLVGTLSRTSRAAGGRVAGVVREEPHARPPVDYTWETEGEISAVAGPSSLKRGSSRTGGLIQQVRWSERPASSSVRVCQWICLAVADDAAEERPSSRCQRLSQFED